MNYSGRDGLCDRIFIAGQMLKRFFSFFGFLDIPESANRNFNSNHFSSRPGTSASHSETFSFSTSGTRSYPSTSNHYDAYSQPIGNFYPRAPNTFYGGNYRETYQHPEVMDCSSSHQYQHQHQSIQAQYVPDKKSNAGHSRQLPKKKKRSGRGKKNTEEIDEDVHVKENGEWDADFHFFGVESPRSRTIRASELQETTKL